jgi:NAD(P)H-dependent nitrite reductase small subunit
VSEPAVHARQRIEPPGSTARRGWTSVCELHEILPNAGVCALVNGRQIAIFRVDDWVCAIDNRDPASDANVLSRGLVGDNRGERVVASPLYKHHYSLATGRCIEDATKSVNVYPARVAEGCVWVSTEPQPRAANTRRRLVVIGNGMAGMRTVEELLQLAPDTYDITVLGAEPHGNYNRILLSPLLAGEKCVDEIVIHAPQWYAQHGVQLHAGDPAVHIDRIRRVVRSSNGLELPYDRVLLATGSKPVVLPLPGKELPRSG